MKKAALKLSIILIITIYWAFPVDSQAAKDYSAERFDVLVEVQPGGDLLVTETVVFRFAGGPFTYVSRELDPVETDGISDLHARLDGQPLPEGTASGQVEIQPGDPIKVTWHFNPVSDAAHTFELSYRVRGAVRQAEADTLIWRAVPESHEYPIAASDITLRYPGGVSLASDPALTPPASKVESSENQVRFTTKDVPADQSVILTAEFAAGSLISVPPQWQAQKENSRSAMRRVLPIGVGGAVIVLLVVAAGLAMTLKGAQREAFTAPDPSQRLSAPPSPLPPALGVKLASGSAPALATLFDLARRGFLRIEETKSTWGKSFTIYRQPQAESLRSHEQALLDALFKTSKGGRESLPMSEAGSKIASGGGGFSTALDEELLSARWLDPERKALRSRLMATGVVVLIVGMAIAISTLVIGGAAASRGAGNVLSIAAGVFGAGGALFIAGLAALVAGAAISPLSNEGELQAARWKGFVAYLRDVSRGREPAMRPDMFELYLPFAAGAGFAQGWAKFFQKQGGAPMPDWFRTLSGSMDSGDFGAIVALMAASDSSASAGADAGGAGASGGGSSGAG